MLLDVSKSMDARDVAPSRLVRARAGTSDLLRVLSDGDRVALAGFAGRGAAFTPLTPDRSALAEMLPALDSGLIRPGGSDLAAGIEAALSVYEQAADRPRVLIIWSDGELDPPLDEALVGRAAQAGVRVLAVALGSEAGTSIPDGGVPLRDVHDRIVTTRRHTMALERLTHATGGALLLADRWGTLDVPGLAATVDRDVSAQPGGGASTATRTVDVPDARPFAAMAFLLLLVEALMRVVPPARARRSRRAGHAAARRAASVVLPASLLLLVGADAPPVRVGADTTPYTYLEQGFALARAGRIESAAVAFAAAAVLADDPAQIAVAYHNLGVLALRRDDLESARDHFLEALVHTPHDHQMRFNAEWTLLALQARKAAAPSEAPPSDDTRRPPEPQPGPDASSPAGGREDEPAGGEKKTPSQAPEAKADGSAGGTAASAAGLATPSRPLLDAGERARWLERVKDDPGRAMRLSSQAEGQSGRPPRRGEASW
jgi:Ca-activated chloride channel family protein